MKSITKLTEVIKKLQKENLLSDGHIFYLTDFHKTKIGNSVANKLISTRIVEETKGLGSWFEKEWRFRKPVGEHLGVKIYFDKTRNQFFFAVKKGEYDLDLYEYCINKIDYLNRLGEKLK
jgi:hypothetical protein